MSFPTLVGEVVPEAMVERRRFPFRSWALANGFTFDPALEPLYARCGSAAEAFFLRPFTDRPAFAVTPEGAVAGQLRLALQVRCAGFSIDAVVTHGATRLAIEIDGMAFHHRTKEQVAADYLRQRRIVAKGYTVIRFTAPEVFGDAAECWRQVDAILAARRAD